MKSIAKRIANRPKCADPKEMNDESVVIGEAIDARIAAWNRGRTQAVREIDQSLLPMLDRMTKAIKCQIGRTSQAQRKKKKRKQKRSKRSR